MGKKQVKIVIDKKGNFTVEKFGYEGSSCTANQTLEVALGGTVIDEKKKPEFFDGDGDDSVQIQL